MCPHGYEGSSQHNIALLSSAVLLFTCGSHKDWIDSTWQAVAYHENSYMNIIKMLIMYGVDSSGDVQ